MQIDLEPFPMNVIELQGPKVLVRPHLAKSTKGTDVVIGDENVRPLATRAKPVQKASWLRGQDQLKAEESVWVGLSGGKHRTVRCTSPDCPVALEALEEALSQRVRRSRVFGALG